jgi:hypothetical protein
MIQRHTIAQHKTGRFGSSWRFASFARSALKPTNLSIAGYHLPDLPFGKACERDSRQSGRMIM